MRFLLIMILLSSCQSKKKAEIEYALERNDTVLAKKIAQDEINRIRASITDSSFATSLDASLQIQAFQFALQKADTSQDKYKFVEDLILSHQDGNRLYALMMKSYQNALKKTSNPSDIVYFKTELSKDSQEWLEQNFAKKRTFEALISLLLLQKDIALISAIENEMDNEFLRKQLDTQYNNSINSIRKNY